MIARRRSTPAPAASSATSGAVRTSCQTIAFATGSPVRRSHSTVVSRWFVIPTAATSDARAPAAAAASSTTARTFATISRGSCSTQPACRMDLRVLALRRARDRRRRGRTAMQRLEEVPWSIAAT